VSGHSAKQYGQHDGKFKDKVVLVTGASSGIGAELSRQFAAASARVVLAARDVAKLEHVAEECRALGSRNRDRDSNVLVVPLDVTVESSCRDAMERAVAHFGKLDILVNNAGLRFHGRFDEVTDLSAYDHIMRVNYLGAVMCTSYALPHLKRARGQIVAIASLQSWTGVPTRSAYCASKHAMMGFFDSIRVELEDDGVSVTVIYPSFVYSDDNARVIAADGKAVGDRAVKRMPGDAMSAEECARLTLDAVAGRKRHVLMTWRAKVGRLLKFVSPALVDRLAKNAVVKKGR
jgi:NAD(P)-dependent dehydrogenase (short-subunit alcohol dehydrogenase family)